ncbi:7-cyano-7-deazaguanine synthase QueC [Thermomonospora echinospora]|uniref:7-cyano-7-deazaguanine synthase QueC n=1 Tax=Thermomonospora echinospora TaxID=1992 RepID=UPI001F29D925|nr:7-cyano-7-deazaguanine synthase QueC [Thermomonospora echinospora]
MVIASGGLDSTTLAYWLKAEGTQQLTLLGVDYGQRHRVELSYLKRTAAKLGAWHVQLGVPDLGKLLAGSALTDPQVQVPSGHYTDVSMRATVVPNRNALLLDLAVGLAISAKADAVAFGAHAGDQPIYPDCRPAFVDAYTRMAAVANEGFLTVGFKVVAPFLTWTKADIVRVAAALGVPFGDTWSCYRGDTWHCGRCGTCAERKKAFARAGLVDPTHYQDATGPGHRPVR